MELNELVGYALTELKAAQQLDVKQNYIIEEVILEVHISKIEQKDGKLKFYVFEGGENISTQNAHKITVKLSPKQIRGNRTQSNN